MTVVINFLGHTGSLLILGFLDLMRPGTAISGAFSIVFR
jgi:hypothetical protein